LSSAAPPSPSLAARVAAEQIRAQHLNGTPVLVANAANAIILSAVLWHSIEPVHLFVWASVMLLVSGVRWVGFRRYGRLPPAPEQAGAWGRAFVAGSLASGVLWGVAGVLFFAPDSTLSQLVLAFVLAGMAAGSAGTISAHLPAFYAYLLPSVAPFTVRMFLAPDAVHHAMGWITLLYGGVLVVVAHNVHRSVTQAFRLRFENDGLIDDLASAEKSLSQANAELEVRVTERTRELEESVALLRESEQTLADLFRESPDVMLSLSLDGVILACSPAIERILGYAPRDVRGRHYGEVIVRSAEARRLVTDGLGKMHTVTRASFHLPLVHANGTRVDVEANARRVVHHDGTITVETTLRDVTERTHLERKLSAAQRLEAIGRLAGGIAHDFNNLLTVVLSSLDTATSGTAASKEALEDARQASLRAAEMTRQLLAFGRGQVLEARAVDLNHVVASLKSMLERLIDATIELRFELLPEGAPVKADPAQLEQVIVNLVTNARDAMRDGGLLTLRTSREIAESRCLVVLAVTDTGIGMDDATRARIFEPFFTATGHTGLGLATVHGIVEQSGGSISVESTIGSGTRFEIRLPCTDEPVSPLDVPTPEPIRAAGARGTETILVVEDEPLVRRATVRQLQAAGYRLLAAADGQDALEMAQRHSAPIHLLLTDVVMPRMTGPALAEALLATRPDLHVIFVSGYAGETVLASSPPNRELRFLAKPFEARALLLAVRAALDGAAPLP
jgi:PAS domain S-box-containing protein